ncbi:MAG: ATP-binding protein [Gammaproteobacteria bacterium]|nr:ATP-binding protein [Gammaproteobacteria bacterium]MDH5653679.1 ATP-binding protein [Gammaproteobacteria bacterium]
MSNSTDIQIAYNKSVREHQARFAKVGCILALALVPAGITLDIVIYPEYFQRFFLLRILCDVILGIALITYYLPQAKKYIHLITYSWVIVIQITMCLMIYLSEGANSSYYAGLTLVILAVGIILPLSFNEGLVFCGITIGLYLIACFSHSKTKMDFSSFYNNLYFLVLTSIISVTAIYFNAKRRFSEFTSSYNLGFQNKELTELDRIKSRFFANISHELRTPLTLILAPITDILNNKEELPSTLLKTLQVVAVNAQRLLSLVNDLLDVIKLEEGKFKLEKKPLNLTELLNGLLDSSAYLARQFGSTLVGNFSDKKLVVNGDQAAMEKIFLNLIVNAIKFTGRGGKVTVNGYRTDEKVVIKVCDTGIGIDKEDLPFVFDRFHQVDSSATRKYQGTGLGLSLVKELTERQAGRVAIASEPQQGTIVTIEFPVSIEKPAQVLLQQPHTSAPAAARTITDKDSDETTVSDTNIEQGAAEKKVQPVILIVDDETDMRQYLVNMLAPDYQILQAVDGRQGLEMARNYLPDLVILDMMMPEMSGLDVCRLLKENSATSQVKIVLLTARVDEASKLNALKNGADDFLTKPFSSLELKVRISNLLKTAALQQDLQTRNIDLKNTLMELKTTQSRLIQSEKFNALGTLSAGLLHEINNPLNYSMTALQLAMAEPAVKNDEFLNEAVQDIHEGMQRIKSIVTELHVFAYPDHGGGNKTFEFEDAVNSAIRFTSHEINNISVKLQLVPDTVVRGSDTHVVQVLVNLLLNAVNAINKTGGKREGCIEIKSGISEKRLSVSVRDNGCGMSKKVMEHIFEPFYTDSEVGMGMGLGLSVCHTLIKNYDGELVVKSSEGEWTEFTFDLPLAEDNRHVQEGAV